MNNEILNFSFFGFNVLITPWKLIGFLGVFYLFSALVCADVGLQSGRPPHYAIPVFGT